MVTVIKKKDLAVDRRTVIQNASLAIRDIYDAIVELVTNADDRYQVLNRPGRIEIEVEERRGNRPSILRVRDFADGMTSDVMEAKLSRMGGRVSGLEAGLSVRGTNSRGAKDVAALGRVTFESVADDGALHSCAITRFMEFELGAREDATDTRRSELGILQGTGTVVTIELESASRIPRHETLLEHVASLVRLRDIIRDPQRTIVLRRLQQGKESRVQFPQLEGRKRVSERFAIPGYPGAEAKLVIYRAPKPFARAKDRFRLGGILVKSRHAIHESTLFDSSLDTDPCAAWFYGRLSCDAVDDLWNDFDERYANRQEPRSHNPVPILDPSRKSGLTRDHPFVMALYAEALKRLRPLVEEERRREENERTRVESKKTRNRLDSLEKAANQFMEEWAEEGDDEPSREPDPRVGGKRFKEHGYALNPPFAQVVAGHSLRFSLSVLHESFPELEVGETVQIECLTSDISSVPRFVPLEAHPTKEGVLHASWKVTAEHATPATGIKARVGAIHAESAIEVFESDADRYGNIKSLIFARKRYRIRQDRGRKRVQVFAPLEYVAECGSELAVSISGDGFLISGDTCLKARNDLGIAIAEFEIKIRGKATTAGTVEARLGVHLAEAEVLQVEPPGSGIQIKLEDVDHGAMRYRWKKNELEIAARHPSLARYLGSKVENFPGQEEKHFRVLLGEIVADAVCSELLRKNIEADPIDYENADWDRYYAEFSEYMARFLPIAHKHVLPEG